MLDVVDCIDIVIDGVDEVDFQKNLIKGGGVVYIREKIVDVLVEIFLVVVDSGKLVDKLGFIFLLLVEVIFMVLIFVM